METTIMVSLGFIGFYYRVIWNLLLGFCFPVVG